MDDTYCATPKRREGTVGTGKAIAACTESACGHDGTAPWVAVVAMNSTVVRRGVELKLSFQVLRPGQRSCGMPRNQWDTSTRHGKKRHAFVQLLINTKIYGDFKITGKVNAEEIRGFHWMSEIACRIQK